MRINAFSVFNVQVMIQGILAMLSLARNKIYFIFLGTEGYGIYGAITTLAGPLISVLTAGCEITNIRRLAKNPDFSRLFHTEILFLFFLIVSQFTLFMSPWGEILETNYTVSALIFSFGIYLNAAILAKIKALGEFRLLGFNLVASGLIQTGFQLLILLQDLDSNIGIIVATNGMIPFIVSLGSFLLIARKNIRFRIFPKYRFAYFKAYASQGSYRSLSMVMVMVAQAVTYGVISSKFGYSVAGIYFAIYGIGRQAFGVIMGAILNVYLVQMMAAYRDNMMSFRNRIVTQSSWVFLLISAVFIFLVASFDLIIPILFDRTLLEYKVFFVLVCLSCLIDGCKQVVELSLQCHPTRKYFILVTLCGSISLPSFVFLFSTTGSDLNVVGEGMVLHSIFISIIVMLGFWFTYSIKPPVLNLMVCLLTLSAVIGWTYL